MWRERVAGTTGEQFAGPAPERTVLEIEEGLGHALPGVLREFLLEVDGVEDAYGTEFVWSAARTLRENSVFREDAQLRELYAPFDDLLFFGDNGGGDHFAFPRGPGDVPPVFVWDHETDHRYVIAPSFTRFLSEALASDGGDWYRAQSD